MNALIATLITIGVFVVLGVLIAILAELDWDMIGTVGCFILFWLLPIPLMIYGVITNNLALIIVAEAMACIASLAAIMNDNQGPLNLILMIPTLICLVDFIVLDQIVGAVIVTVFGLAQLSAVFG